MKIKTNYNRQQHERKGETNSKPSKTIPDQTLSIPELIKRYANGQSLGGVKTPFYEDTDILNGKPFASFDLSEQYDIVKNAKQEYTETIARLRNTKQPAKSTINVDRLDSNFDEDKRSASDSH
jgi:hypothetical protein